MRKFVKLGAIAATASLAILASACSSSAAGSGGSSAGGASSNTATYAELPGSTPNYIFPMLTGAYYSVTNIEQFQRLSFRSLYWIGNSKGQPVVDPAMSLAAPPTYSDNDSVVTIHLNNYTWSNGTPVTTRDVAFWINLLKANKSSFAAYIPGEFPDNLKSYKIVNSKTIVLTLTGSFNPTWFTYDQLSQITPLPRAWDKTSASGAVGNYDETTAGAKAVFNFLTAQSKDIATYGTNPLWGVVDGPWKLVSYNSDGYAKFEANTAYAGPTKPKLKYFVEEPFTTDTAELNVLRSGNNAPDYGYLPEQDAAQSSQLASQGYTTVPWQGWGTTYFLMNFNNPKTGPLIHQAYIRQAMQSLIDEPAFVSGPLKGYGHTVYGPVPATPSNPYVSSYEAKGPWPFNPKTATSLLTSHGWTVKPNGVSTCAKPGTGSGQCGAGIAAGADLEFNLNYASGTVVVSQEMQALKSQFSEAGIQLNLTSAPFDTIISMLTPCTAKQSGCSWQMLNYGGGWTYGVDPYPTGDQLFATGSGSNSSNYSDAEADKLISATIHGSASLTAYENYLADQVPVLWMPQPVYQISEISTSLKGVLPQSPIESLTPENWYFSK
ncbi:MAG TPA: ABC transporter substrate-binding protein [Streptosporangiaceae bacterium]|nr:ABC transporter substrate-binding protein [Streptosporangiaceae bacterium]